MLIEPMKYLVSLEPPCRWKDRDRIYQLISSDSLHFTLCLSSTYRLTFFCLLRKIFHWLFINSSNNSWHFLTKCYCISVYWWSVLKLTSKPSPWALKMHLDALLFEIGFFSRELKFANSRGGLLLQVLELRTIKQWARLLHRFLVSNTKYPRETRTSLFTVLLQIQEGDYFSRCASIYLNLNK